MATTGRCHEECCQPVAARYYKRYAVLKARGVKLMVPVGPSLRKVQALQALGHTRASIAERMGTSAQSLSNTLGRDTIKARTAVRIDEVYQALEMVVAPDSIGARQARRAAERNGWLPPLAYDDIEEGVLAVAPGEADYSHDRLDLDLVDYVLQYHDFKPRLSPLEKSEIVRRWKRAGRSERSLCRLTGWREGRYHRTPTQEAS